MTARDALLIEWRDATQAVFDDGRALGQKAAAMWERLANAEHRLMEYARSLSIAGETKREG